METKRSYQLKSFSLISCKLVIRKKLVNNKNLNKNIVFIILILYKNCQHLITQHAKQRRRYRSRYLFLSLIFPVKSRFLLRIQLWDRKLLMFIHGCNKLELYFLHLREVSNKSHLQSNHFFIDKHYFISYFN